MFALFATLAPLVACFPARANSHQVGDLVEFKAGQYTYHRVAEILSTKEEPVICNPLLADRVAALYIKPRSRANVERRLSDSLGIEFVHLDAHRTAIREKASVARSNIQRLAAYDADYDRQMSDILARALAIIKPRSDSQSFRQRLAEVRASPQSRGGGVAVAHLDSDSPIDFFVQSAISFPTPTVLSLWNLAGQSGLLESLHAQPFASRRRWQDVLTDTSLPLWVRQGCDPSLGVQDVEKRILIVSSEPDDPADYLDSIRFDPLCQRLELVEGVIKGNELNVGQSELIPPDRLPGVVLARADLDGVSPELRNEVESTKRFILAEAAEKFKEPLRQDSIALAMLAWATQTDNELICETSVLRDVPSYFAEARGYVSRRSIATNSLVDAFWRQSWLLGIQVAWPLEPIMLYRGASECAFWLSISREGDIVVGRNVLRFLDDLEPAPVSGAEALLAQPGAQSSLSVRDASLHEALDTLHSEAIGPLAASHLAWAAPDIFISAPLLRLIGTLPPPDQDSVWKDAATFQGVSIPLSRFNRDARKRFAQDVKSIADSDNQLWFSRFLLGPDFVESTASLSLHIRYFDYSRDLVYQVFDAPDVSKSDRGSTGKLLFERSVRDVSLK